MMGLFEEKSVSPMLIAQMQEPFNDDGWIYELKLDGCRCIGYFGQNGTCLRNKRNMELLPRFPELKGLHRSVSERTVLDGELVVLRDGVPDFFELQRRTLLTDRFRIEMAAARHPASFVAYDCLCKDGRSIMDRPLLERKEALQSSVREDSLIAISRYIPTDGIGLFRAADERELEGVVAKRAASLYYPGRRTKDWTISGRTAGPSASSWGNTVTAAISIRAMSHWASQKRPPASSGRAASCRSRPSLQVRGMNPLSGSTRTGYAPWNICPTQRTRCARRSSKGSARTWCRRM